MKEISTMQMLNSKEFEGIRLDSNGSMLDYLQALTQRLWESQQEEEEKVKGKEKLSDSEKRYKQHSKKEKKKKKKKTKGEKKISASEKRDEQHSEEEEGKEKIKLSDSEQKDEQHSSKEKDKWKLNLSDSEQQWEKKKKDDGKRESNGIENLDDQQYSEKKMKRSQRKRKRELTSDDEFEEPKRNKNKKSKNRNSLALPKELPRVFMETLQRFAERKSIEEPQLVIEKEVEKCDCSKGHNRLSIPLSKLNLEFLTPDEQANLKLRHNNEKNVNGIDVDIIEPTLHKSIVSLRRWEMMKKSGNSSITFNLTKHWNQVVKRNSLCPGQFVQLWSTRVDGKLWLLIVRYEEEGGGGGEENNQNSTTSSDSQSLPGNGNESAGPSDQVSGSSKSSLNLEPDQEHHGAV